MFDLTFSSEKFDMVTLFTDTEDTSSARSE